MSKKIKKKVPELRFSEFKGDWQSKTLEELAEWSSGGTPSKEKLDYWNGDIPWISASSMYYDILFDSDQKITELGLKNGSRLATKGSILILVRGSILYNRIPMGITGRDLAFNQDVKCLKIQNKSELFFLFYWLKANENLLKSLVSGTGIGAGKLDTSQLKGLILFKPFIEEQEKIASFLGAVDRRLTQLRRKQELLQIYKRGVMQKIFSQEIRFKQDDGAFFPNWQETTLGKVANFSKGKGLSKEDLVESGNLKCIRYAELYTIYDEVIYKVFSSTNVEPGNLILSLENDVIIPASGESAIEIAKAACVKISGVALGGDLNIIKSSINGEFLAYYLNHYRKKDIARVAQGNTVVHLYSSQLAQIEIEIPSQEEQKKIVKFLTMINQKIKAVSQQIDHTEQFKKGLLQKMFV
jgi:restriction endonuclease S subunit